MLSLQQGFFFITAALQMIFVLAYCGHSAFHSKRRSAYSMGRVPRRKNLEAARSREERRYASASDSGGSSSLSASEGESSWDEDSESKQDVFTLKRKGGR